MSHLFRHPKLIEPLQQSLSQHAKLVLVIHLPISAPSLGASPFTREEGKGQCLKFEKFITTRLCVLTLQMCVYSHMHTNQ